MSDDEPTRITLRGTKGSLTLELVPRWWWEYYARVLLLFAGVFQRDVDVDKLAAILMRTARWRVIHTDMEIEA